MYPRANSYKIYNETEYYDLETGEEIPKNKYKKNEWRIISHDIIIKKLIDGFSKSIYGETRVRRNYLKRHEQLKIEF